MTQKHFCARFGFPLATLRHWELGNRRPRGPSRVLLYVISRDPEAVLRALRSRPALPRDSANNTRLLAALKALAHEFRLDHMPSKKTLDGGFSTAAEGELGIDFLFAAASKTFEDYREHIIERVVEGVPVRMLDIEGMLLSKQTDRPDDIADRQRLQRLKSGK